MHHRCTEPARTQRLAKVQNNSKNKYVKKPNEIVLQKNETIGSLCSINHQSMITESILKYSKKKKQIVAKENKRA